MGSYLVDRGFYLGRQLIVNGTCLLVIFQYSRSNRWNSDAFTIVRLSARISTHTHLLSLRPDSLAAPVMHQVVRRLSGAHKGPVVCLVPLASVSGEAVLLSGGHDGNICMWDAASIARVGPSIAPCWYPRSSLGCLTMFSSAAERGVA